MRQLLPFPADDVVPYEVYRVAPGAGCIRINMVASVDGRVTDADGRAGALGGDGDRQLFRALRALADAVLVGAGTARIEGYGPHRLPADLAARRRADGRPAPAAVVVVTRSLDLDPSSALFTDAATPTIVLTSAASVHRASAAQRRAVTLVVAGDVDVDLIEGLRVLADEHGIHHVLCEGGPTLNTALLATGVVDELCLTVAPLLTGRYGHGIVTPPAVAAALELRSLCEQDGELYARYAVRALGDPGPEGDRLADDDR
jgi:5-amino-6-(5-phosphoribosylamino)uracil reductase